MIDLTQLYADLEMDNLLEEGYYSPGDKKFVEELERYGKPRGGEEK